MPEPAVATSDAPLAPVHPRHHSWKRILIRALLLLAVVGLIAVFYIYVLEPSMPAIEQFVKDMGPWGPVAFIAIFFVATMIFLPESIIAIAGGTLFGLWWGWVWVVVAGTITAAFTFGMVRLFLRKPINRAISRHPKLYAVEQATGHAGFKILFLLRLAPVNYSMLNYLGAVSPCRFRSFMFACLGMIPGNFSTVYMGYMAKHTSDLAKKLKENGHKLPPGDSLVHEITLYGGLVAAIIASLVVARVAVKAIHRESAKHQAALAQSGSEAAPGETS
ncbi:MAG: VTT domain-containing protein [Phycisphaerales bacterium]|nr:VTT domain-containing protein [Phycisphaerales bacterium]